MIDPQELRDWLLAELATEKENVEHGDAAQDIYRGRVDALVRVGTRFDALSDADLKNLGLSG